MELTEAQKAEKFRITPRGVAAWEKVLEYPENERAAALSDLLYERAKEMREEAEGNEVR